MSKTRQEKIASYDEQITQIKNRREIEIQKMKKEERAARTRRLCSRHGLLEKYMPDLINISDEQFETFIKTGIDTKYGRNRLAEIIAEKAENTSETPTKVEQSGAKAPTAEPNGGVTVTG